MAVPGTDGVVAPGGKAPDQGDRTRLFVRTLDSFLERWDERVLQDFYRAPSPLGTTQFFIPSMSAALAPAAFEVAKEVQPTMWVIHYKGSCVSPRSGTFRFVGFGDDILLVRLAGRLVFDGCITKFNSAAAISKEVVGKRSEGKGFKTTFYGGDWFTLEEGRSYPMEVLLGEQPGGVFKAYLMIQQKDVEYPMRPENLGPVLPLFQIVPTKIPEFQAEGQGPTLAKEPFAGLPGS